MNLSFSLVTLDLHLPHLKQIVEYKSLVHVIISGLPSLDKSHILNHPYINVMRMLKHKS